jgi:hypothetical protein
MRPAPDFESVARPRRRRLAQILPYFIDKRLVLEHIFE